MSRTSFETISIKPLKFLLGCVFAMLPAIGFAQHHSAMDVTVDAEKHTLHIRQELTFFNESPDTLRAIVLNDWNNAYSDKNTPLGKRFSDEFVRSFHLARDEDRGSTKIFSATENQSALSWTRPDEHPDLVELACAPIAPGGKTVLRLNYDIKLPSDRFTKYGVGNDGAMNLRDWFLTPARYEGHAFVRNSNNNLDDIANGSSDFSITLSAPKNLLLTTDLVFTEITGNPSSTYQLTGKSRTNFSLFLSPDPRFEMFRNEVADVASDLESKRIDDITKAIAVDRIVNFVNENLGSYAFEKITVSQADYERNPFYGLNQLPSFINVFRDDFLYELKFLKTYLNNYIKNSINVDPRKDNWVYDAVQVYLMMKYIDEYHPGLKVSGSLSSLKLLRSYNIIDLDFNEQYSYFYMLMARKNLDQPVNAPKNTLIKFNEQIAGKYRAGLSLKYLDGYLGNGIVEADIRRFIALRRQTTADEFHSIMQNSTEKNIDWFSKIIIGSREIIDYKFDDVTKTKDSVSFSLKSREDISVPVPVYGVKDNKVVFKEWISEYRKDSVYTFSRNGAEKIVLNYKNELPEYNLRNNWKSLKKFRIFNRPIKFVFFKDLEDPYYNQVLYVPTLSYNLYDGLTPGIRLYNKTVLDKPFIYDINPSYSFKAQSISGSASLAYNQYLRDSQLYHIRYYFSGSSFHYAPDASYLKLNPSIQLRFRPDDFRDNRKELITIRNVIVDREKTDLTIENQTENYSVFDVRYTNVRTEVRNHFSFTTDWQTSAEFGKASVEASYRNLYDDNRQIDLRMYVGAFLYNHTTDDFFSFGLDRPTDYLFDYNYYGRSETSGFFSQQIIISEGGFKSKLSTPFANQWIATLNGGVNIWNWVEVYGDAGYVKNRGNAANFVYDSGIRLNLVTDYFELYLPVYSSNGWEIGQSDYNHRIRFVITLDPKILINLFTRKWF
jgi:hypothetical protein